MEVIYLNKEGINFDVSSLVVCVGEFDGLHLGHQELVNRTLDISLKEGLKSAVMTFYPHPAYVLNKRKNEGYLLSLDSKIDMFDSMGVDYLFIIDFNLEIASMSHILFYDVFLSSFNQIVAGFDFRFGFKGLGNVEFLKENHKERFTVIDSVEFIDEDLMSKKISSTKVRELLTLGNVKRVNDLLGRNHFICAKVVKKEENVCLEVEDDVFLIRMGNYKVLINDMECLVHVNGGLIKLISHLDVKIDDIVKVEFIDYIN